MRFIKGVEEGKLSSASSRIEVYAYDGSPLQTFDLGRSIASFLVDESAACIYAFDRNEEGDIVFCYKLY